MYDSLISVHVIPFIGSRTLSNLSVEDVETWQTRLIKRRVGDSTRRRVQQVVAQAIQSSVDEGHLSCNAFREAPIPIESKPSISVPTLNQIRRLLKHATDEQTEAMILLASTAMLRVGELLSLKIRDLDFKSKEVAVPNTVSLKPVKGAQSSGHRQIVLPAITLQALRRMLLLRGPVRAGEPLFPGPAGKHLDRHNFRNRVWVPLLQAARLPQDMHFDSLRYVGTALLLEAGTAPEAVAKRARLRNARMLYERHGDLALQPEADTSKRPNRNSKTLESERTKRR